MKKKISKILCAGTILLSGAMLGTACGDNPPDNTKPKIQSMQLVVEDSDFTLNTDTSIIRDYVDALVLDTSDIDLFVIYDDGSTKTVEDGFTITQPTTFNKGSENPNAFSVTYDGFTLNCELILNEVIVPTDINEVEVTGIPESVEYGYDFYELLESGNIEISYQGVDLVKDEDYSIYFETNGDITTETNKSYICISSMGDYFTGTKQVEVVINPKVIATESIFEDKFWNDETFTYRYDYYRYNSFNFLHIANQDLYDSGGLNVNISIENAESENVYEFSDAGTYTLNVEINTNNPNYVVASSTQKPSSFNKTVTINPLDITTIEGIRVSYDDFITRTYNGEAIVPYCSLTNDNDFYGDDGGFDVAYSNNINACTWDDGDDIPNNAPTITVTGKGNYTGTLSTNFKIVPYTLTSYALKLYNEDYSSEYYFGNYPTFTYDGSEKRVNYKLFYSEKEVPAEIYTVNYENNINASINEINNTELARVYITLNDVDGASNFAVDDCYREFIIDKAQLNIADYVEVINPTYDRKPHLPVVTLKQSVSLPDNTINLSDFSVVKMYADPTPTEITDAGNIYGYYIKIELNTKNYTGVYDTSGTLFEVLPREISFSQVKGVYNVAYYKGTNIEFDDAKIDYSVELADGSTFEVVSDDYTITYRNNIEVGDSAICEIVLNNNFIFEDSDYYNYYYFSIIPRVIDETYITEYPVLYYNPLYETSSTDGRITSYYKSISSLGKVNLDGNIVEEAFTLVYSDYDYDYYTIEIPGIKFVSNETDNTMLRVPRKCVFENLTINGVSVDLSHSFEGAFIKVGDVISFSNTYGNVNYRLSGETGSPLNTFTTTIERSLNLNIYDTPSELVTDDNKIGQLYIPVGYSLCVDSVSIQDNIATDATEYNMHCYDDRDVVYQLNKGADSITINYESDKNVGYRINGGVWVSTSSPLTINNVMAGDIITLSANASTSVNIALTDKEVWIKDITMHYVRGVADSSSYVYKTYYQTPTPVFNDHYDYIVTSAPYDTQLIDVSFNLYKKGYTCVLDESCDLSKNIAGRVLTYYIVDQYGIKEDTIKILLDYYVDPTPGYAKDVSDLNNLVYVWFDDYFAKDVIFNNINFYKYKDDIWVDPENLMTPDSNGRILLTDGVYYNCADSSLIDGEGNIFTANADGYIPVGDTGYYYYNFEFYEFIRSGQIFGSSNESPINVYSKVTRLYFEDDNLITYNFGINLTYGNVYNGMLFKKNRVGQIEYSTRSPYTIYSTPAFGNYIDSITITQKTDSEDNIILEDTFVDYIWYIEDDTQTIDLFKQAIANYNKTDEELEVGDYKFNLELKSGYSIDSIDLVEVTLDDPETEDVDESSDNPHPYIKIKLKDTSDNIYNLMIVMFEE